MPAAPISRQRALVYLVLTVVCWSLWGVITKKSELGALSFCFFSTLASMTVQSLLLGRRPRKPHPGMFFAVFLFILFNISVFAATKMTTAANTVMLQFCSPIFSMILSWFFLRQKPARPDLMAVPIVLLGIFLFFFDKLETQFFLGNLTALASGLLLAGYNISISIEKILSPKEVQIWGGISLLLLLAPSIATDPNISLAAIAMPLLNGAIVGVGWWFYLSAIGSVTPTEALILISPEALLNPLLVALVLGETPGWLGVAGSLLVFSTVLLFGLRKITE